MNPQRTALVHEWLDDWGGSESVLVEISRCFLRPDLFALIDFLPTEARARINHGRLTTTFIQSLPLARSHFWYYLGLMPLAIEALDLRDYELIVSSNHAVAKGVLTNAEQLHLSYVHSPMRYAWDLHHEYLADYGVDKGLRGWLARLMCHRLRQWDRQTASNVDLYIANSINVARRIWRAYRRRAWVIPPPADLDRFSIAAAKDDYYVVVSRLVSYKRVDLIVRAFGLMPEKKLLVIGDGPELDNLKKMSGTNIEFLGRRQDCEVADHLSRAKALVFAANEDFGITPVEAQAAGTPVVAFGQGGALETVIDATQSANGTGIFFTRQTPDTLSETIRRHEHTLAAISPEDCRRNAQRFSTQVFHERFTSLRDRACAAWDGTRHRPGSFESAVFDD